MIKAWYMFSNVYPLLLVDPFTPATGTAETSLQLDLFSMKPVDDSNSFFSSVSPPFDHTSTAVTTTTSSVVPAVSTAPTIDLFAGKPFRPVFIFCFMSFILFLLFMFYNQYIYKLCHCTYTMITFAIE